MKKIKKIKSFSALLVLTAGFVYAFVDIFTNTGTVADIAVFAFGIYISFLLVDEIVGKLK